MIWGKRFLLVQGFPPSMLEMVNSGTRDLGQAQCHFLSPRRWLTEVSLERRERFAGVTLPSSHFLPEQNSANSSLTEEHMQRAYIYQRWMASSDWGQAVLMRTQETTQIRGKVPFTNRHGADLLGAIRSSNQAFRKSGKVRHQQISI